jgi:hypothetical protein
MSDLRHNTYPQDKNPDEIATPLKSTFQDELFTVPRKYSSPDIFFPPSGLIRSKYNIPFPQAMVILLSMIDPGVMLWSRCSHLDSMIFIYLFV